MNDDYLTYKNLNFINVYRHLSTLWNMDRIKYSNSYLKLILCNPDYTKNGKTQDFNARTLKSKSFGTLES
jgi:hypothetical protein